MNRKFNGIVPELKMFFKRIYGTLFPAKGNMSVEYKEVRDAEIYCNGLGLFLTSTHEEMSAFNVGIAVDSSIADIEIVSPVKIITNNLVHIYKLLNKNENFEYMLKLYIKAISFISFVDYVKLVECDDINEFIEKLIDNLCGIVGIKRDSFIRNPHMVANKLGGNNMVVYVVSKIISDIINDRDVVSSKCWSCRNCKMDMRYGVPQCIKGHILLNKELTVGDLNKLYPEVSTNRRFNPKGGYYEIIAGTSSDYVPLSILECPHKSFISR